MPRLHAKCACQSPVVWQHGGRRRRCGACGKTWSVRPRRRGRKPGRVSDRLSCQLLVDDESPKHLARSRGCSVESMRRRGRSGCRRAVAGCGLAEPAGRGPLVLLADGLWFRFRNRCWVLYNMAVKPVGESAACFLEPVMFEGRETAANWRRALATIPPATLQRIRALVADGFSGSKTLVRQRGWVFQRCHVHLDAMLCGRPGRARRRRRGEPTRQLIALAVREARSTTDPARLAMLMDELRCRARNPELPARICGVVRRFVRDVRLFRAYLDHPDLDMPATTNVMESRHSRLRNVTRCVNNPAAALLRIRAYTRIVPYTRCNGTKTPQN